MTARGTSWAGIDLDDTGNLKPVASAVVIGIGGSGIQTITRLRDAVRSNRPEEAAIDAIQFVGIDAVDEEQQNPPLPENMGLGTGEFFNLVETPFDAHRFIQSKLPTDTYLQEWWDPSYEAPVGPLTEGLKRERMLGRLAFHRAHHQLVPRIQSALTKAVQIGFVSDEGDRTTTDGTNPKIPTVPVYIINSSTGGTGSSGFLSVVFAVWTAARDRGYFPQIRCITYLPSVFRTAVFESAQGGEALGMEHDANAFAYFREMDHFLTHGGDLGRYLGRPTNIGGADIPDRHLIKQVYLIGSTMKGVGEITNITDAYNIASEALYQFLVTEAGMPLVGVDATNTDRELAQLDRFDKPRRYCSLGIARVVFPGDTYRRHLTNRYIDWYITGGLLHHPDNLREIVETDDTLGQLRKSLELMDRRAGAFPIDQEVRDFLDTVESGMDEMERTSDVKAARNLMSHVKRDTPTVVRSLRRSAGEHERKLLSEFEAQVSDKVFATGYGVPFAVEMLERLAKNLTKTVTDAEGRLQSAITARINGEGRVNELLNELQKAANRALYEQLINKIGAVVGQGETEEDIARQLGQAIQSWAKGIHSAELAAARVNIAVKMSDRLATLRRELDKGVQGLRSMANEAHTLWTLDALAGKDAGPSATTTLIPRDAQPEVEYSALAQEMYRQILEEHSDRLAGDDLDLFIKQWMDEEANRGFFSLGSDTGPEAGAAWRTLRAALLSDADRYALHRGTGPDRRTRLPSGLVEAQQEKTDLARGVKGMLALSRSVCWSWEEGKFQLEKPMEGTVGTTPPPTVSSVIAAPRALASVLDEETIAAAGLHEMPDPERIVALSVEWALPIHALHPLPRWKAQYDRVQRLREADPTSHVPVHTDRRFPSELTRLVPVYFDESHVAKQIGQALVFRQILKDPASEILDHYDHTRNKPAVPPISLEPDGRWDGAVLHEHNGRLKMVSKGIDLGKGWPAMLTALGDNQQIRSTIDDSTIWLNKILGPKKLLAEVEIFLSKLDVIIDHSKARPEDVEILNNVLDAISEWQGNLRDQSL